MTAQTHSVCNHFGGRTPYPSFGSLGSTRQSSKNLQCCTTRKILVEARIAVGAKTPVTRGLLATLAFPHSLHRGLQHGPMFSAIFLAAPAPPGTVSYSTMLRR